MCIPYCDTHYQRDFFFASYMAILFYRWDLSATIEV